MSAGKETQSKRLSSLINGSPGLYTVNAIIVDRSYGLQGIAHVQTEATGDEVERASKTFACDNLDPKSWLRFNSAPIDSRSYHTLLLPEDCQPSFFDASSFKVVDELEESTRRLAENFDSLEAFQIFTESESVFGGLCAEGLGMLHDFYPKQDTLTLSFACTERHDLPGLATLLVEFYENSRSVVPLRWNGEKSFESDTMLASAIDVFNIDGCFSWNQRGVYLASFNQLNLFNLKDDKFTAKAHCRIARGSLEEAAYTLAEPAYQVFKSSEGNSVETGEDSFRVEARPAITSLYRNPHELANFICATFLDKSVEFGRCSFKRKGTEDLFEEVREGLHMLVEQCS